MGEPAERGDSSRWVVVASAVAPLLVALALVALVVVPFASQRRLRHLSDDIALLAEPCRYLLDTIAITAGTQSRAARSAIGFPEQKAEYGRIHQEASTSQERAFFELLGLSARLSEEANASAERLFHKMSAWQARPQAFFQGDLSLDEYRRNVPAQDQLYQSVVDEWSYLARVLREISEERRADRAALARADARITSSLAFAALLTLLLVLWLARRGRLLESAVAKRQLAEREASARADVLAQVSHDLRSPLTAIVTSCAVVRRTPSVAAEPVARRALDRIEGAARRMTRLVGDLLDHARLSAGRGLGMNAVDIDVEPVLLRCREEASPERPERVDLVIAEQARRVVADPDRLEQVVINLLGNAIKYSPPGHHVRVEVEPSDEDSVFRISDDGPGVAKEDRAHLFEPFWQSATTRRPGYGLGLPIARAIVEAHGGHIWLENGREQGSTFAFTLPRA